MANLAKEVNALIASVMGQRPLAGGGCASLSLPKSILLGSKRLVKSSSKPDGKTKVLATYRFLRIQTCGFDCFWMVVGLRMPRSSQEAS